MKKKLQGKNANLEHPEQLYERGGAEHHAIVIICSEQSRLGLCALLLLKTFHINESAKEWKLNETI